MMLEYLGETDAAGVIEKGIAPGDTVVTDGQLRLFPGAQVQLVDPAKLDAGKS